MLSMFSAAWTGHTEISREMASDIKDAIDDCGWKDSYVAGLMGLTVPQLSRQLAGSEPLNAWRLAFLPVTFEYHYMKRRLARIGAEILTADQRELMLCAAILGAKRMAKAGLGLVGFLDRKVG